jgi:putative ABC transport system permease protein
MLKNHLKIALRHLRKHKGHTLINISGLALGMACCLLILLYVQHELSFDQYHQNKDRLYRLATRIQGATFEEGIAKVNGPWGIAIKKEVPEVEETVRFVIVGQILVGKGEKRFYESNGLYADSTALRVFDFPMLQGEGRTALVAPNTMAVTRDFAQKYFGEENPLGQTLTLDNRTEYLITALLDKVPSNSHFTFDFLLSLSGFTHPQRDNWVQWNQFYTYLLLQENVSPQTVAAKIPAVLQKGMGAETAARFSPFLQPLPRIHLYSHLFREISPNSDVAYLYIFSSVALLILIVAAINFINLSTAQGSHRAKEVGVRKVLGSPRQQLVGQFLTEAILLCVFAVALAISLAEFFLPTFNALIDRNIEITWRNNALLWLGALGLTLLLGGLAGSYPAFALSAFQPVSVLKGQAGGPPKKSLLRNGLVVFQFALSAFLLMATGVIHRQTQFVRGKNLGYTPEQIITIPVQSPALARDYETVKSELLQHPNLVAVSASANLPGGSDWGIPVQPEGIAPEQAPPMRMLAGDHDFINTYQVQIAEGRNFSKEFAGDSTNAFIINEEAARQLKWDQPLGKMIAMPAIQREAAPVIGVVKDFHFRSLHERIGPLLFFIPLPDWMTTFSVRIRPQNIPETLKFLEEKFARLDPSHPFTYSFFDERMARQYQSELRLQSTSTYAAGLGIVIACLGLFGLVSFATAQRTKEIGIRKVLGATTSGIVGLLSKETVRLVVIANLVACPAAYFIMQRWLQDFAYRAEISPAVFASACLLTLLIALLTVGYRSIKAALANPVEALRYE